MPFLADLDHPPQPRWRNFLIGALIAIPFGLVLGLLVIPALRAGFVEETAAFDERLRQEDAYMNGVCSEVFNLERDETLCQCVLAVEFPSLDCRGPFNRWSIERQLETCSDDEHHKNALAFCSCVESLSEQLAETDDEGEQRQISQRYAQCAELDDALYLPELVELVEVPAAK